MVKINKQKSNPKENILKVFIVTEGGKNVGFGHLTRCISLSQALEERGINPVFIINGDETVCGVLEGRKHYIFNWLKEKKRLLKKIKRSAICIVDSYMCNENFYKKISSNVDLAVYLDDHNRLSYAKGFVVNGSLHAKKLCYPKNKGISYLLGSRYIPMRREFWNTVDAKMNKTIKRVLITFGGDDKRRMTSFILNLLTKYYPQLRKFVVVGKAFQDTREIENLKDPKTKLIYNSDSKKMKKIMLQSDIAISSAGQTLYELARLGIPTIGVCVSKNQLKNAKSWEKTEFLEYAGWFNNNALGKKIKKSIEKLNNIKTRKQKSKIAKNLIDGGGSRRTVKEILSYWFKDNLSLRKASIKDARNIFNLFNGKKVRDGSFNPRKISWDHHLGWMRRRMEDEDCTFFIITNSDQFYGQIRFDIDSLNKEAAVGFSMIKQIRGLNFSSHILARAVNNFFAERPDINKINAHIREKNIASIKSFEGARFSFQKDININKHKAKLYTRGK